MSGSRHLSAGARAKPKWILLRLAGVALTMTGCDSSKGILLPLEFSPSSLQCDDKNLLLFGSRRTRSRKDIPIWSEAIALRIRRGGLAESQGDQTASDFRMDPLWRSFNPEASEFLSDSSWPRPGTTVYAILTSSSPERSRNGELMRSWDLAASWTEVVGAPQGLIGVSFYSGSVGYVWSASTVYHTKDGGASWTSVESPGTLVAFSRGLSKPSLDPTGALWMPINHHGTVWSKSNLLARFSAAARPVGLFPNSPFRIDSIDASQAQSVWFLGRHRDRSQLELRRIHQEESKPRVTEVANFDTGLAKYLGVSGSNLVVGISQSKEGVPLDRLVTSRDAGNSWKPVRLPEARIRIYCMTRDAALWLVGSSGRVYFEELPAEGHGCSSADCFSTCVIAILRSGQRAGCKQKRGGQV